MRQEVVTFEWCSMFPQQIHLPHTHKKTLQYKTSTRYRKQEAITIIIIIIIIIIMIIIKIIIIILFKVYKLTFKYRVQNNSWLPAAASTFSALAGDFSQRTNIMLIEWPTQEKVTVML